LEYSIREEIPYGIWGGKTPTERGVVLKRTEILKRKERVLKLRNRGVSTEDIAQIVGIKIHSVYRIFSDENRARKRENQSNPKTNTQSADLSQSLESAQ
jgi:DNA invertase Pin-like site-specific DNA recombinase